MATKKAASKRDNASYTTIYQAPTSVGALVSWTWKDVQQALLAHESGDFRLSGKLATSFNRDSRIKGCMGIRTRAMVGLPFSMVPPDARTGALRRQARKIARETQVSWKRVCSEATARALVRDKILMGVAVAQIVWSVVDGKFIPTVEHWPAEWVRYNVTSRAFEVWTLTGYVEIHGGDGKWIVWAEDASRSWLEGDVLSLGVPFILRAFTYRDWARFNERHGLPIMMIREPAGADPDKAKAFFQSLREAGSTGVMRLPRGQGGKDYDAEMLEAKDSSWQAFQELIKIINVDIAVLELGGNLNAEVSGGSLAAAKEQSQVRMDLVESDSEGFGDVMQDQLMRHVVRLNYGAELEDLAPRPTYDPTPPEDAKARADTRAKDAESVERFQRAGVDVQPILDEHGLAKTAPAGAGTPMPGGSPAPVPSLPDTAPVQPAP